mgnify:FL=1
MLSPEQFASMSLEQLAEFYRMFTGGGDWQHGRPPC